MAREVGLSRPRFVWNTVSSIAPCLERCNSSIELQIVRVGRLRGYLTYASVARSDRALCSHRCLGRTLGEATLQESHVVPMVFQTYPFRFLRTD